MMGGVDGHGVSSMLRSSGDRAVATDVPPPRSKHGASVNQPMPGQRNHVGVDSVEKKTSFWKRLKSPESVPPAVSFALALDAKKKRA
jgi:hypothetical protein